MIRFRLRSRHAALALGCICAGVVFRFALCLRAPVSYDEVFVMGVGLDEMIESARAFFIDVPLLRSNAGTPLWWWAQAVPALLTGQVSLWGLRLAPLLLGGVTLAVTFVFARARVGRGPAALLVMLAAFSDILAFCNSRGEFAESLMLLWIMPCVCLVGHRRHTVAKGVLGWLILMTHLGKGLFFVGVLALSDAVVQARFFRARGAVVRSGASLAIAIVPMLCWLMIAGRLTASGPLMTDIGPVASTAEMLWKLTASYGETKGHMVSSPLDAAQVWLDGWVWPTTALTAFPLLIGTVAAVRRPHGRRGSLCLGLMPWIGLGLIVVIARGLLGARFHLLYLPALWLTASIGLWQLRRLPRGRLVMLGMLWVVSVWAAFSWTSWEERIWHPSTIACVLAGAGVLAIGLAQVGVSRRSSGARNAAIGICAGIVLFAVVVRGPMRWAPFARMEPFAGRGELAAIDAYRREKTPLPHAHGRTLYIDLANYFLKKADRTTHDLRRAERYARLETERVPGDARAWFYLGETLREMDAPIEQVRSAWERSYKLKPTPMLERRLQDLRQNDEKDDPQP